MSKASLLNLTRQARVDREKTREMRPQKVWRALAVVWFSGGVLLSACAEGDDPGVEPPSVSHSESSATTPSGGVTQTPADGYTIPPRPAMDPPPTPLSSNDPATAAANLAEYYVQLYPYVLATGDLTEWDKLAAKDCEFCSVVREKVESQQRYGGWSDTTLSILDMAVFDLDHPSVDFRVDFLVDRSQTIDYDETSSAIHQPTELTMVVGVSASDNSLKVASVELLSAGKFAEQNNG